MVSLSRRRVLAGLGGVALLVGAGAKHQTGETDPDSAPGSESQGDGPVPTRPADGRTLSIGASDAYVTAPPTAHVDIRDHGAKVDGSHDDRDAIQAALDRAARSGTPDAVYFPAGTIRVGDEIDVSGRHSGLTLCGAGSETHLRLDGGHTTNTSVFKIYAQNDGPLTGLTLRDLRIDCQKRKQKHPAANVRGITAIESGEGDADNLVENVWFHDAVATNCHWGIPGTTFRYVSSWGAERWHGIGIDCAQDNADRPIVVEYCHFRDNGTHGIDASGGHTVVRHVLSEENGWGGKNTSQTNSCRWENVVFRNNDEIGFMTSGAAGSITMDRVMAERNGKTGFYIQGGGDLRIGEMVALGTGADTSMGNIFINDDFSVTADSVRSGNALSGPGLNIGSEPTGSIRAYTHDGHNSSGYLRNRSRVEIRSVVEDSVSPLPTPTNPELVFR